MKNFDYTGISDNGIKIHGSMLSQNEFMVTSFLESQNITPIFIRVKKHSILEKIFFPTRKIKQEDLSVFCLQMHTLLRSGVPLLQALHGLAEITRSKYFNTILNKIALDISSGLDLSLAMKPYKRSFGAVFLSMIQIGEATGELTEIFKKLKGFIEFEIEIKKKTLNSFRYPIFVMLSVFFAVIVVNIFIIPTFAAVFQQFEGELPLYTRILMGSQKFVVENIWYILTLCAASICSFMLYYKKSKMAKVHLDHIKLKLPIVGSIFHKVLLTRFAKIFALTVYAGIPIVQAMQIASSSLGNLYIEDKIRKIGAAVEHGESISQAAKEADIFTPLILQMVTIGEETGAIGQLFLDIAVFYEHLLDYSIKKIAESLEPIMLFFVGSFVLLLALSVFLPIWDLGTVIQK